MLVRSVFVFAIFCSSIVIGTSTGWVSTAEKVVSNVTSDSRNGKFFSLFSIVKFNNDACTGSNSYNGTCLTAAECSSAGGTAAGSCASGFGVCCTLIISKCGQTTSKNCTYFTNPGGVGTTYTTGSQCSLTVKKCDSNICQLRVDFLQFSIAQPSTTTNNLCVTDVFTVTGASNNVPSICGDNTGQHMYLHMSANQDTWTLNFILSGTSSRTWNLKISQIPCDSRLTAPPECLQYFSEPSGTIKSYNFATVPSTDPGRQISNQDYTMCIRKNQGFCGICYTACPDSVNTAAKSVSFTISELTGPGSPSRNDPSPMVDATTTTPVVPAIPVGCTKDWVMIPCASDQTNSALLSPTTPTQCIEKFCGGHFNTATGVTTDAAVYSYRTPFEIRYYTDSTEPAASDANNMGFCLNYVQQPCTSNGK